MESKTFCPFPWMHLHVSVDGKTQLCCISEPIGDIKINSLEDTWNSKEMKDVRLKLLNNEKPSQCHKCFHIEDNLKSDSFRTSANQNFANWVEPEKNTLPDGTVKEMVLQYVDFRFNNLCNFKCRICSSVYSSSIASEKAAMDNVKSWNILTENGSVLYEELQKQYPYVKRIYFAGGEPIMQKEHFNVLNDLIELDRAKDITLLYSTNGSKFKNSMGDMFDYWKYFKQVDLSFSIDGYGAPAEYWRSGTDWQTVEKNIRHCKDFDNIETSIHSAIGWPNAINWADFITYALDTDMLDNLLFKTSVTPINHPQCYSLLVAPEFKKQQIRERLHELKKHVMLHEKKYAVLKYKKSFLRESIDLLLNVLDEATPPSLHDESSFSLINDSLDKIRGEDFFTAFPEHLDMKSYLYE